MKRKSNEIIIVNNLIKKRNSFRFPQESYVRVPMKYNYNIQHPLTNCKDNIIRNLILTLK